MSGLIGTAVIVGGRRAGRVSGVVLEDGRHIAGVLVEGALGGKCMMSLGCAGKGARAGGCEPFSPGRAITTGGQRLGRVSDLFIDERTGRVDAIEVSRGYLDDLVSSRLICSEFSLRPQSGDAVVADVHTERGGCAQQEGGM